MFGIGKLISSATDLFTERKTDKDIEILKDNVKALNYELSLLRYKNSDDEDIQLAYEYLKKRPFCAPMYPYEKTCDMAPVEIQTDKDSKMRFVMHNQHPLYFPLGEKDKLVPWFYRFAVEDDDVAGKGYRQRNPHAYQFERYHVENGDVLIDAGGGLDFSAIDMIGDVIDKIGKTISKRFHEGWGDVELDVGSVRGMFALVLSVCAYHRTTDYENLKRFFEIIGYHTETQPGYIYTNLNDGHGLHSLRRGIIRASNQ